MKIINVFYKKDITYYPSDYQLDLYSEFIDFKEHFYCFLKDDSLIYKMDDGYVKIKKRSCVEDIIKVLED